MQATGLAIGQDGGSRRDGVWPPLFQAAVYM